MNKPPLIRTLVLSAALASALVPPAYPQTSAPASPTTAAAAEETIVLSPFLVSEEQEGRYRPIEATSGGRVRVNLFNAPQSVSVVTRELVEDVGAGRLLDALQYIPGVTESTIPNGLDRVTIRGFQTDGQRIDNFAAASQANLDPVFVERLEVVKGPNAILAPAGVPGGTINAVTRKPQFNDDFGSVAAVVGLYNAQRVELDVNHVFGANRNMAFRVVGAYQDTEGFAGDERETFAIMPMFSLRTKRGAELVLQAAYTDVRLQNWFGVPIDPSAGTDTHAKLLEGVPDDLNTADNDYRRERRPEFRGLFTLPLTETVSMRLAMRYTDFHLAFLQNLASNSVSGGAIDPRTGRFTPGIIYGPAPDFAPSAAPAQPRVFTRSGTEDINDYTLFNVQNDFIHLFKHHAFSATTVAGWSFDMTRQANRTTNSSKPPIDYDAPAPATNALTVLANRIDTHNYAQQVYLSESLSFLQERVILTGGYSFNNYDQASDDLRTGINYRENIDTELLSYGILAKPLPGIAVYYSYAENATPSSAYNIGAQGGRPTQSGQQDEFGLRFELFNHRLTATVSYFDIVQNNYSVPNPGNYVPVPPVPPLPALVSDRNAKGVEFEVRATITDELSLIGNYTDFENRDPNDVPFRGTAETSYAAWVNYSFPKGSALDGLALGAGLSYLGDRPGDAASGVTAASTSTQIIPNQPSFYLPARTLVNLSAAYRISPSWRVQLNIDNLFDEQYLAASINRSVVVPGDEFNARVRVTYTF